MLLRRGVLFVESSVRFASKAKLFMRATKSLWREISSLSLSAMEDFQLTKFVSQQCKSESLNIGDALKLFDEMLRRPRIRQNCVIPFNQLLTAITKMGHHNVVVSLFREMGMLRVPADLFTSNISIKCYCRLGRVDYGFSLLGIIIKRGSNPDTFTYGTLIDGLCKSGYVREGLKLFRYMKKDNCMPEVVEYSTMFDGLCKYGMLNDTTLLFSEMSAKGVSSNVHTYNILIEARCKKGMIGEALLAETLMLKPTTQQAFDKTHEKLGCFSATETAKITDETRPPQPHKQTSLTPKTQIQNRSKRHLSPKFDQKFYIYTLLRCKNSHQVRQVHAHVVVNNTIQDLTVANKLLHIYCQHKALGDAYELFSRFSERDSVTWSVMAGGFAKAGDFKGCFETFRELLRRKAQLDNYTLPFVIRACRDLGSLKMGRQVHSIVWKNGLVLDRFVYAAFVDMYAKCRDVVGASYLFDNMLERDLVSYTVMIGVYTESGRADDAFVLFDRMREEGLMPDKVAMVTLVSACAKLGAMHKARFLCDYIERRKFSSSVVLGTAMIDMYAKCGSVDLAREIFDRMQEKNVISWSAMIAAYGYHGQGKKALELFYMMLSRGVAPNRITFLSLLYACSHSGLVEEGLRFFHSMWDDYAVRPDMKHYTCMVDLLGRAGRLNEAFNMIDDARLKKDAGFWGALLGACRIHGNVELAEKAANNLLRLQSMDAGHYVLLSNIYAKSGRWDNVAKIRDLMAERGLKKITGWTWIEVDDKIYQFSVGDRTHPMSKEIYEMLKTLCKKLELAGYVPDTEFVLHDVDEEVKVGSLYTHSEKLAIAFGLLATADGTPIRITKNLRVCGDCHTFIKYVSSLTHREIIVRDANRFHHFKQGACSCGDYW